MYNIQDITSIHLELTSKCQARCPMCPRRINGGIINPLITLDEITLDKFKDWFDIEFIKQLDSLFMCGNLGDPIIAQDCVEIFKYLRATNPVIELRMHTNGSARSADFWKTLAKLDVRIVFGIDGLEDTHNLYRVGTDFNQIIRNATTFIKAGGYAEWHMLVFKHNEHQVAACKLISEMEGFKIFQTKNTTRFVDGKFNVLDDLGRTTHILYPTDRSKMLTSKISTEHTCQVECKAQKYKQLYISADGNVSPCCWLDLSWQLPKQDNRIEYMDVIGRFPNLNDSSLLDIFNSGYFTQIEDAWNKKPLMECSRQCGSFDKLGAQFAG